MIAGDISILGCRVQNHMLEPWVIDLSIIKRDIQKKSYRVFWTYGVNHHTHRGWGDIFLQKHLSEAVCLKTPRSNIHRPKRQGKYHESPVLVHLQQGISHQPRSSFYPVNTSHSATSQNQKLLEKLNDTRHLAQMRLTPHSQCVSYNHHTNTNWHIQAPPHMRQGKDQKTCRRKTWFPSSKTWQKNDTRNYRSISPTCISCR